MPGHMALSNRQVILQYDVPGPILWHERLVLEHITGDDYVVASPDQEVFYEELSILNDDLVGIRVKPAPNVLPAGIVAGQVYPLPVFTPAEVASLRSEARRVLEAERAARGLGVVGGGGDRGAGGSADQWSVGSLYWVAAESGGGMKFGDLVVGVVAPAVKGSKSVHVLADGTNLFVECIDGGDRSSFLQRPATLDHRIVPQEIDALGKPECSLKDASKKSVEKEVSWTLTGPRTTRWCISYLVMEGLGFEGHHERFRNLCKVDAASWGIQEHLQLSMIAKHMIQVDQYNGYNSLSCEVVFRRLQTIEFAYAEKARESEAKAVGGRLSLEEQQTFGGVTRQAGTLMVCPELLDHVRAEVERDATLAKHLRKAREERELARRAGKKGNKAEGDAP